LTSEQMGSAEGGLQPPVGGRLMQEGETLAGGRVFGGIQVEHQGVAVRR
jgi:hypothetical protein